MDALQNLLRGKSKVEVEAQEVPPDVVAIPLNGAKLPAPIGMMARMLGVQPEDMMNAVRIMAGAADALQSIQVRLAVVESNQLLIMQSLAMSNKVLTVLEQRSRQEIMPHGADDTGESK